jgi:hypothetical protein
MENKIIYKFEQRYDILAKLIDELLNKLYSVTYPKAETDFKSMAKVSQFINKDKNCRYKFPIDFYYIPQNVYETIVKDFMESHNIKLNWDENMKFLIKKLFEEGGLNEVFTPTEFSNGEKVRHCENVPTLDKIIPQEYSDKVKEVLKNYLNTYKFDNRDYNSFYFSVMNYAPSTSRESVVKAWKEILGKDIEMPSDDSWIDEYTAADTEDDDDIETDAVSEEATKE